MMSVDGSDDSNPLVNVNTNPDPTPGFKSHEMTQSVTVGHDNDPLTTAQSKDADASVGPTPIWMAASDAPKYCPRKVTR
jgi:hypothetical protein